MSRKIPLFEIYWDNQDVAGVTATIESGCHWAAGAKVTEFEKKIADYTGAKYVVAVNSGTSALHAMLLACDIGQDDEVIVPSFTFIATANGPLFVGAKPVFADIEEKTLGLDPDDVSRKITARTKAIIPVHYAGCPCAIVELRRLAEKHNILLLEDAAESLGAEVDGRKVGTFGHAAILSFCQNKIITTGEGGAIITSSADVYEKAKLIRSHGRPETADYFLSTEDASYVTLGYNFRMSNITAALGIAQICKIDSLIDMRRQNADYITRRLSRIGEISAPATPIPSSNVYQMYPIRIKDGQKTRDALKEHLAKKGITTRIYFEPVHLSRFYRKTFGYHGEELPVTEKISKQILSLPMYPNLSRAGMDYVAEQIDLFFN